MHIETRQPETEALIRQRMENGHFADVEAVLLDALRTAPSPVAGETRPGARNLVELLEPVRGILTDAEVESLFSRNCSSARTIDLA